MTDIASGFQNPDGEMLKDLTHCLDYLNNMPFFRSYEAHSWAALNIADGALILDVACGTGFDVIEMAKQFPSAEFYGLDISEGFLAIARARSENLANVQFLQGSSVVSHAKLSN